MAVVKHVGSSEGNAKVDDETTSQDGDTTDLTDTNKVRSPSNANTMTSIGPIGTLKITIATRIQR